MPRMQLLITLERATIMLSRENVRYNISDCDCDHYYRNCVMNVKGNHGP